MSIKILSTFPILSTERLTLRQTAESDVQEIFLLRSNRDVNKYLNRQPAKTPEDALKFIRQVNENFEKNAGIYWVICQTGSDKLIGTICLFDFSNDFKRCEIGYELLPDYQAQGMMSESLTRIIEFAFHELGFDFIDAFTHKDNQSSTKLLQRFSFMETMSFDEKNPNMIVFRLLSNG